MHVCMRAIVRQVLKCRAHLMYIFIMQTALLYKVFLGTICNWHLSRGGLNVYQLLWELIYYYFFIIYICYYKNSYTIIYYIFFYHSYQTVLIWTVILSFCFIIHIRSDMNSYIIILFFLLSFISVIIRIVTLSFYFLSFISVV